MGILTNDLFGSALKAAVKAGVRQGAISIVVDRGGEKQRLTGASIGTSDLDGLVAAALDPKQPHVQVANIKA